MGIVWYIPGSCFLRHGALLTCAQGRQLPEADALALLRRSSRSALWRYLHHLISLPAGGDVGELHTELAMVLIDEAQDLLRLTDFRHVKPGHDGNLEQGSPPHAPPQERIAYGQPSGSEPGPNDSGRSGDAGELQLVRRQLQEHLASSAGYDVEALLERLAATHLYEERVIVHAKVRTCTLRPRKLILTYFALATIANLAHHVGPGSLGNTGGRPRASVGAATLLAHHTRARRGTTSPRCGCWRSPCTTCAARRRTAATTPARTATLTCWPCCSSPARAPARAMRRPVTSSASQVHER